jgi:hypothetical protein
MIILKKMSENTITIIMAGLVLAMMLISNYGTNN